MVATCAISAINISANTVRTLTLLETGNFFSATSITPKAISPSTTTKAKYPNNDTITDSICTFNPDLAAKMDTMAAAFGTPSEAETLERIFPTCEKISIDYAVMENADYIYTIPGDFGWSDVGTWGSLWTLLPHDANGNAVVGENVHLNECKGCIVHAPGAESVVLQGLEDCIVVEREGRMLICKLSQEQRIKDFVK